MFIIFHNKSEYCQMLYKLDPTSYAYTSKCTIGLIDLMLLGIMGFMFAVAIIAVVNIIRIGV